MDNNYGREQLSISGMLKPDRSREGILRPEQSELMQYGFSGVSGEGMNGDMPVPQGTNHNWQMQRGMSSDMVMPRGMNHNWQMQRGMGSSMMLPQGRNHNWQMQQGNSGRGMMPYEGDRNVPMWMQYRPGRPFYMNPPEPWNEKGLLQDLDYLKQMYPQVVRNYMDIVAETVDKLDYEGGMIYDEYPDQYQLKRLSQSVVEIIRRREVQNGRSLDGDALPWGATLPGVKGMDQEELTGTGDTEDKWIWVEYLVRVLLSLEIYRRRNHKSRYF